MVLIQKNPIPTRTRQNADLSSRKGIMQLLISFMLGVGFCNILLNAMTLDTHNPPPKDHKGSTSSNESAEMIAIGGNNILLGEDSTNVKVNMDTVKVLDDTGKSAHLGLSNISSRQHNTTLSETQGCKKLSPFGYNEAKLRIFIYQKQEGNNLANALTHYLQALTYDEVVIIANEEDDGTGLLASNPLYEKMVSSGIHFWQCTGTLQDKGKRWTEVMTQYKDKTDFLLPIDVDEYLAIEVPPAPSESESKSDVETDATTKPPSLVWDRPSLLSSLKALPPSNGKPYKTLDAKPVPTDCEGRKGAMIPEFDNKFSPRHCDIPSISQGNMGCFAKNIFAGKDFTSVDNGNHHGPKDKTSEWRLICETKSLEDVYIPSNFVLVHYQVLDFSDWLIHMLKRAVDYKYELDCDKPNPNWPPFHVCNLHAKSKEANFSVHEMKNIYNHWVCSNRPGHYDINGIKTLSC